MVLLCSSVANLATMSHGMCFAANHIFEMRVTEKNVLFNTFSSKLLLTE